MNTGQTTTKRFPWPEPEDRAYIERKFQLLDIVHDGLLSTVYKAHHRALDAHVALKLLPEDHVVPQVEREGKLLAKVSSPYIVEVYDMDRLPSGRNMLVIEWIDGGDLHHTIKRHKPLAEEEVRRWMSHTCHGMFAAEEAMIVHRDLKPSNILLDQTATARVADFGIARRDHPDAGPRVTDPGLILGTAHYMAPEQAEDPHGADTRADIYSFGATYYHALVGDPPFTGANTIDVICKHKTEPLVAPGARREDLSPETCELIERCLAKSPADRFQSFSEIRSELDAGVDADNWSVDLQAGVRAHFERFASMAPEILEARSPGQTRTFELHNGKRLIIEVGDILDRGVDVIVSSTDTLMGMNWGVAHRLKKVGGRAFVENARRFAPVKAGQVIATGAGDLPARFVLHGITLGSNSKRAVFPSRDILNQILTGCFYHTDGLDVGTMSVPLLGSGFGGLPRDVSLETIFRFLLCKFHRGATRLEEARIFIYPGKAPWDFDS